MLQSLLERSYYGGLKQRALRPLRRAHGFPVFAALGMVEDFEIPNGITEVAS